MAKDGDKTLVMVKPHAMHMYADIMKDFEVELSLKGKKLFGGRAHNVSKGIFDNFYASNRAKYSSWWDTLIEEDFEGGSIFVAVYEGENVLRVTRDIIGHKNVLNNPRDTIRGKYGRKMMEAGGLPDLLNENGDKLLRNAIHSTDETPGEFNREYLALAPCFDSDEYRLAV